MKQEILDAKDLAVLAALDRNSRATYSQIARQVKLSKQSVDYRIASLVRRGVLNACMPMIDYEALGYVFYRAYLQFTGLTPEEEEKILQNIYEVPRVRRISTLDGKWDCSVTFISKEPYGVRESLDVILGRYGSKIKNKMVVISTYCERFTHKFLNPDFEVIQLPSGGKNSFELDELDRGILDELLKNARVPLIEMAAKLNTSYKVISYRLKRLEKVLIRAYCTELNYSKLGMARYRVFVELQNTKERLEEMLRFLRSHPNVFSFSRTIGETDLEFDCLTRDASEFHSTLSEYKAKFSDVIREYSICITTNNLKPAPIKQFAF